MKKKLSTSDKKPLSGPMLTMMPVMAANPDVCAPLSSHEGNRISGFFVALPIHEDDPSRRLENIRLQTVPLKRLHVAVFLGYLVRVASRFIPRILVPFLVSIQMKASGFLGISSFRGPHHASYEGSDVDQFSFYGRFNRPPGHPFMMGISSVAGTVRLPTSREMQLLLIVRTLFASLTLWNCIFPLDRLCVTLSLKSDQFGCSAQSILDSLPGALEDLAKSVELHRMNFK